MKIESVLPVFPGFYGTLFEADEEPYIEDGFTFDDYKWDYEEFRRRTALACIQFVEQELKSLQFDVKIEYQGIYSPREYNFSNDSINVEYSVKSLRQFREYIGNNITAFQEYLDERFTTRDGFISFHSTSVEDWLKNISNPTKFYSVLDFILRNELEDVDEKMYSQTVSDMWVGGELI